MIPKLRFSEFDGPWRFVLLGDLDVYISDGNYGEKYPRASEMTDSGIPFIRANNINAGRLSWYDMKYISQKLHAQLTSGHIKTNDILITTRGDIGLTAYVTEDFDGSNINAQICLLRFNKASSSPMYMFQYLTSDICEKQFKSLETGSALKQLPKGKLGLVKICYPSLAEQQKIADFLTAVDERIALQEKKIELLEQYKKGVMQQIFSQKIRFKDEDGKDFPEWKDVELGDIGHFKTSSVDKIDRQSDSSVRMINYMDVYKHSEISKETLENFQLTTANARQLTENNLKKGDILFTPSSETPDDIGHSVVILEDMPGAVYSYHLIRFRPNVTIDVNYSNYFCNIPFVLKQIAERCQGATRYTITIKEFAKIIVPMPISLIEQNLIADFLTDIDKKIELEMNRLEIVKQFKKGLLQQMFV